MILIMLGFVLVYYLFLCLFFVSTGAKLALNM